jgi:hypothetical protein
MLCVSESPLPEPISIKRGTYIMVKSRKVAGSSPDEVDFF